MRLIIVRHGIAVARRKWDGPDADRPLTPHGARQAQALGTRLARYDPDEIISSPSLRCRQTVEPLAARTTTPVKKSKQLELDAGPRAIDLIRRLVATRPPSSTIILCTHREVLVQGLPALAAEFGVALRHRPPGAKGSYWAVRFRGDRAVTIKYSRPS